MISLDAAAREDPSAPFLLTEEESLSFGECREQVRRIAIALGRAGLADASLLAVQANNTKETVLALLALLELGVPFVPVHPKAAPAERARLVELSGAEALLDDDAVRALTRVTGGGAMPAPSLDPEAPAVIMYTSGTTGTPKGAELPRRALAASARASATNLSLGRDDVWLLVLPLCHIGGLSVMVRCLLARRPFRLMDRFDPHRVAAAVDAGATLGSFVPTMVHDLLDGGRTWTRLRAALVGGAGASSSLLAACARAGFPALTTYGLTEACSQVASQAPRDPFTFEPGVGRPLPSVEVRLCGDDGLPVPAGETGEIVVAGPTLMLGYRGGPRLSGAFATGDLGRFDEAGRLHVVGRKTDLIVTGGENVHPREVEDALLSIPGVRAACVVGVPDARWGEIVAAMVVLESGRTASSLELEARARLASFRLPRAWSVVDALPTLPGGKVDRRRVRASFA